MTRRSYADYDQDEQASRHTSFRTAIRILRHWQEKRPDSKYVFNLVKEDLDLDNAEELYRCRNNATKCINQSLNVVGEQLGLDFSLSMHVARHTFAIVALNKGCQ